jgi:NAD(P)-dependent dehydrogenase (short-subunit alcohol dehydrogenase family)
MTGSNGKYAVVTGGGSGIGCGIALALAGSSHDVIVADLSFESARMVAREVTDRGTIRWLT